MANADDKDLIVLRGEIKTPPMSRKARSEAGFLLRKLQQGDLISMPHSRPMPSIGAHCHELRIVDENSTWRIIYRIDNRCRFDLGSVQQKDQRNTAKYY
jgi:phage-related protein